MTHLVLAALTADPEIRGALIVLTAFLLLPGSVYLVLSTNLGAKMGFLLAAAGLCGWCAVMGWVWVSYGIGIKGIEKHWTPKEVVTGDLVKETTIDAALTFPKGWKPLLQGATALGDAQAAADKVLVVQSPAPTEHGAAPKPAAFTPVFNAAEEYAFVDGYEKGGENCWLPGGLICAPPGEHIDSSIWGKLRQKIRRGPFHKPHYAVVQVAPVLFQPNLGGTLPKATPDPSAPVTSVVMVRNLGNLRFPSFVFAMSFSLLFAIIANALHRRDKEIWAARELVSAEAG